MSLIPGESTTEGEGQVVDNQEGEPTSTTEGEGQVTDSKYLFADGIAGEGEIPEWFKPNKYKTVSDQAKAYTDLESKFGAFKGSPKDGKYEIEGINFEENELMGVVAEWGNENQLSTEGLESLVAKVNELSQKQIDEDKQAAITQLGDNADKRLNDLSLWGKNNLEEKEFEQFQGLAQTAGQVEVLEKLIGMTKNSKLVDTSDVTTLTTSKDQLEAEIKKEYFATNEQGQRLVEIDPTYKKKIDEKMKNLLSLNK